MTEMTPATVREQLKRVNHLGPLDSMRVVLLWKADRARIKALDAIARAERSHSMSVEDDLLTAQTHIEALERAHNAAETWGEAISVWGPHDERTTAALVAWDIARAALAAKTAKKDYPRPDEDGAL